MNNDIPAHQRDVRWLIIRCAQDGRDKPTSAEMEAFAERVAIKMESNISERDAREQAAVELLGERNE